MNYQKLFHKFFLSKWYYYLLSLVFFLGLSYWYVKTSQPVYEISSKLFIKEKNRNYGGGDDWIRENLNFVVASENVKNEVELLSSFALVESVVEELELHKHYFWDSGLIDFEAFQDYPIVVDTFEAGPGVEGATFELKAGPTPEEFAFYSDSLMGIHCFGERFRNEFGSFFISRKHEDPFSMDSVLSVYIGTIRSTSESYHNRLKVDFADTKSTSSTLLLSVTDPVPARGEAFLKQLIENYRERKQRENIEIANRTMSFIDQRLAEVRTELLAQESNVEAFKVEQQIASTTTSDLNIVLQNLSDLQNQQKDLEVQLSLVGSIRNAISNQGEKHQLIASNLPASSGQIEKLIKQYNDLVLRREQLLVTGQPSNPAVIAANLELDGLKSSINESLRVLENDLQRQLSTKNSQEQTLTGKLRSVPRKERVLTDKDRNRQITEDLYNFLQRKREEASLAFLSEFTDLNVIDPPRSSSSPVAPKSKQIYLGGAFGGMVVPFLIFYLASFLRDSVLDENDIKAQLPDVSVLGVISKFKGKEKQVVLRQRNTITAEQFRSLRINARFLHQQSPVVFMITSSTSGEGKTFIASNLATSFSMTKKKVVILDFDLYKGDLLRYMGETVETGLTDYLYGSVFVEDIIYPSQNIPNLDVIGAGPLLTMRNELFSEQKFNDLFAYLRAKYEIILIDTPPMGIISDALLLQQYVNLSLLVVRSGHTKKQMLQRMNKIIEMKQITNPYVILNDVNKSTSYGRGYGSYKKYLKGSA